MILAQRNKPLRRCIGCAERREKASMIRIVRTPGGDLQIDTRGKMPGRGCYVCPQSSCVTRGLSGAKLARALRMDEVSEESRNDLAKSINDLIDDEAGEVRR